MQLIGQYGNLDIIDRWKDIPNFIIVQGDEHTGKTHLVKYICSRFKKYYVQVGNTVDDVRKLVEQMNENSDTVYHFKNFHQASLQAKNALLKVTEETPAGNTIVISGMSQLSTLESRARKLVMEAYSQDDMVEYLSKYYLPDVALRLYKAGIRTPAKCELYKDYPYIEQLLEYTENIFTDLTVLSLDAIIVLVSRFERRYKNDECIDACALFLDMLIHLVNYNVKNSFNMKFSYSNVVDILVYCRKNLISSPNIDRKLLLYNTFYRIRELGGSI